jgi:hypothetical protein
MSKRSSQVERRSFIRIAEEDLLVCEPFDPAVFSGVIAKRVRTFTKNVSENGILFEANEAYGIGALLKLQIDIPGWEKYKTGFYKVGAVSRNQPLVVLGKVVRVEDIGEGVFDIGVVFTAVDGAHREALKKYLANDPSLK